MRRPTLGIVGAVCIASIASAADLPVKAPIMPVTPVYSWTGFYLGGHVGGLYQVSLIRTRVPIGAVQVS